MQTGEVLDAIGGLSSQLKAYAAKLPAIVHLTVVPTGIKPKPEAVDDYEAIVSRFRNQSAGTAYKGLNEAFVESLEAFEVGKLLGSVQPLLAVLDHLERMQRDQEITADQADARRIAEYRAGLHKILPGNKPELDGAGRGL
ncbi:MAG TPA: hypothetical protein VFX36_10635 [Nitrospira sp.]|jgi:hypothetical protein|nr:hypothetical protein [Nitrospira sp.]